MMEPQKSPFDEAYHYIVAALAAAGLIAMAIWPIMASAQVLCFECEGNGQILDDADFILGTDSDIRLRYDEAGDDRAEWHDGTNLLAWLKDAGTTGDFGLTGKMGIGPITPSFRLEIKSAGAGTQFEVINSTDTDPIFQIDEGGAGHGNMYLYDANANKDIQFLTNGDSYRS